MSTTAPSAGCVTLATKSVPYQRCRASFVPCPSEACSAGFEFRHVCVAPKGAGCSRGALLIFACHVTSPAFKAFKGPGGMISNIGVFRLYLSVCGWVLLRYGSVSVSVCWTGVCGRACCKADVPRDGCWGGGSSCMCHSLSGNCCAADRLFEVLGVLCTRHDFLVFLCHATHYQPCACLRMQSPIACTKIHWVGPMPPLLTNALQDCWAKALCGP